MSKEDRADEWEYAIAEAVAQRHPYEVPEGPELHVPHLLQAQGHELIRDARFAIGQLETVYNRVLDETVLQTELDVAASAYALGRHDLNTTMVDAVGQQIARFDEAHPRPTPDREIQLRLEELRVSFDAVTTRLDAQGWPYYVSKPTDAPAEPLIRRTNLR